MPLRPQPKVVSEITVEQFYQAAVEPLNLKLRAGAKGLNRPIADKSINRPALAITGYYKNFAYHRIQLFGAGEMSYLHDLPKFERGNRMDVIGHHAIPCMIITRNLTPLPEMIDLADAAQIPLFSTPMISRDVANIATFLLDRAFAPRVNEHGTLMDVRGIGTLLRGDSGVGKSECALALIERGHSLVADDLVRITLVNEKELLARSSEMNRGYMECRGIGIINIAEMFGVRSVRLQKTIDLVVTFAEWKPGMEEERTGLEQDAFEILGQQVPHIILPVRPGRDMARLVEVASMVQALKLLGHNPAAEFNERLIRAMQ